MEESDWQYEAYEARPPNTDAFEEPFGGGSEEGQAQERAVGLGKRETDKELLKSNLKDYAYAQGVIISDEALGKALSDVDDSAGDAEADSYTSSPSKWRDQLILLKNSTGWWGGFLGLCHGV
jgi:hypothetical protein